MKFKNILIFVVDDDDACAKLCYYYLKRNGYNNVKVFSNEKECLECLTLHPNILIADYLLRDGKGNCLIRKAKNICPDLTCFLMSSYRYEELIDKKVSLAFVDSYIKKGPASMQELMNCMANTSQLKLVIQNN